MKHFIYFKTVGKWKRNGSSTLTFSVYQNKGNQPVHIGTAEAESNAYRGDDSTVMNFLIEKGLLPKKLHGYYRTNDKFKIIQL